MCRLKERCHSFKNSLLSSQRRNRPNYIIISAANQRRNIYYEFSVKINQKIYIFATSGGSDIGKTAQKLEPFVRGGAIADARRVASVEELSGWKKNA